MLRRFLLLAVLLVLAVPCAQANPIVVVGNLNATMSPGETRTFTADVQSNTGSFSGQLTRVKVTLYYTYPANAAAFNQSTSATIDLAPRQFILTSNIANSVIGAEARANLGDLHNIMVEFEVTSTTGEVIPLVSSIDNGTGDSTFRVE